ncbi:uncharacterized protein J4E84_011076 [Alternaria hordeiaustralica]|uniref:uncharacterized protein n=1 Tax=Alternaria hordeiaustralica TaxID=1187925 RepID=UPI0020C3DF60|nr:uncharacterized protein J4E84_011076 [Alternaria hordeiaustralica]KAI4673434.1 hypothetical protein J4E84_011076 [Alternaria hordeiaustralica]
METRSLARFGKQPATQLDVLRDVNRQRLNTLSDSQAKLSSIREDLLIERERVRATSRKIQQKRIDAGNAEAMFMSRLSQFVNEYPGGLSRALLAAYDDVRQKRDDLGEIEDDYLRAESDLTGAEWTFVARETQFYQFDINSIFSQPDNEQLGSLHNQHPKTSHHLPLAHIPPCPPGSLSPSQVLKLPPPPPPPQFAASPPPLTFISPAIAAQPPPDRVDRDYAAMVAGVETLKKELDKVRRTQASSITWDEGDEVFFPDGDGLPDSNNTTSASEFGNMVYELSKRKAKAEQYKAKELFPVPAASRLARRSSDPANSYRTVPEDATAMRRTQTESAAAFMQNNSLVREKIRAWSLTHLKEDAVQKHLYLNTLAHYGIASPTEGDWELRAAQFWSHDSLVENEKTKHCKTASVNETGCNLGSYHDSDSRVLHEDPQESFEDDSSILSSQLSHSTDSDDDSPKTPSDRPVMVEEPYKAVDRDPGEDIVPEVACTCTVEYGDAAQRKDSVQSTKIYHHISCPRYKPEVKTRVTSQGPNNIRTKTDASVVRDRCGPAQEEDLLGLPMPPSADSKPADGACFQSLTDTIAQPTSTNPWIQTAERPTPNNASNLQFTDGMNKPGSRPPLPQRRTSGNRLKEWLSSVKKLRSKSTPTIAIRPSAARTRKQSVA